MNEKSNDDLENNNSMGTQENAGKKINLSKFSDSIIVWAIRRCPIWGGSKVPPKIHVFI